MDLNQYLSIYPGSLHGCQTQYLHLFTLLIRMWCWMIKLSFNYRQKIFLYETFSRKAKRYSHSIYLKSKWSPRLNPSDSLITYIRKILFSAVETASFHLCSSLRVESSVLLIVEVHIYCIRTLPQAEQSQSSSGYPQTKEHLERNKKTYAIRKHNRFKDDEHSFPYCLIKCKR